MRAGRIMMASSDPRHSVNCLILAPSEIAMLRRSKAHCLTLLPWIWMSNYGTAFSFDNLFSVSSRWF